MRFQRPHHASNNALGALLAICSAIVLLSSPVEQVAAADRQSGARRLSPSTKFKSPCGTSHEVAARIGRCLDPMFARIYGELKMPKNDQDLLDNCQFFEGVEKCVRNVAKDCLTGIHKTTTGAIASATRRFRLQECKTPAARARYYKPSECAVKHGKNLIPVYQNYTGIAQGVRDLPDQTPEQRLMKNCCMLIELDKALVRKYDSLCPESTDVLMGVYHAMVDDARSTLCAAPKCNHALDKVVNSPYKPTQNLIEPVMEVMFMLNAD